VALNHPTMSSTLLTVAESAIICSVRGDEITDSSHTVPRLGSFM
jgi:hypothetical protein